MVRPAGVVIAERQPEYLGRRQKCPDDFLQRLKLTAPSPGQAGQGDVVQNQKEAVAGVVTALP